MTIAPHLASMRGWTVWRRYTDPSGNVRKLPLRVDVDRPATIADPGTATLAMALAALRDRHSGVGLFMDHQRTGVLCVDVDSCYDPGIGDVLPWAADILRCINSYTEISPSGCGVKVFVRASLPARLNRKAYHRQLDFAAASAFKSPSISLLLNSYATVTGERLENYPPDVESRDLPELFFTRYFPQTTHTGSSVGRAPSSSLSSKTAIAGRPPGSLSEAIARIKRTNYPVPQSDGSRLLYFIVALAIRDWRFGDERVRKLLDFWQSHADVTIPLLECSDADYHISRTIASVRSDNSK
jgi:hypothetical protein